MSNICYIDPESTVQKDDDVPNEDNPGEQSQEMPDNNENTEQKGRYNNDIVLNSKDPNAPAGSFLHVF